MGFRLAGLRRVFVATPENYQEVLLKAMEEPDIGVLAADGKDLDLLTPNVRTKVMDSIQPVVVPVGRGETDLREKVKRAIGIDLYKEDE